MTPEMCGTRWTTALDARRASMWLNTSAAADGFYVGSTASWFVLKRTSVTPTELSLLKLLYVVHLKWTWFPLRQKEGLHLAWRLRSKRRSVSIKKIKAQRHAEESLEMKRQICVRKCQCEVKPVPTELEYIMKGHVTSSAQRETGISNWSNFKTFLCRNTRQVCHQLLPFCMEALRG